ncbi:MAG: acyl-ACP--UDP-N-acetylglucosamine O-acyltransferase [Gammaproteobacteria bacterium]|nr:acyl-ACP--UDP-N-acetylglucosamine O-acyltransferase [Gammaproteobacteria bacterium]
MIHPTAIIDASAKIADDCEIGAYTIIGADVEIGPACWIGPHVVINGPTRIGRGNRIFQFASLGDAPQDLKYAGEPTRLELGDNNIIREYATMNRGTVDGGGLTKIGNDNLFMGYTHIAHDCQIANNTIFSNAASLAGHVHVGDYAILGGFTLVHQFSEIGAHAFTGMGTAVNRDVPPFVMATGNHANAVGINKNGLKRRGFSEATIAALHKAFLLLIKQRGSRELALEQTRELAEQFPDVKLFVEFVQNSKRGVVR